MATYEEHPVHGVLADMAALVASKAHDYADNGNVYSNFEGSARSAGVSVDLVFQVMIGIKVERLRQLMSGKIANHESIEDTIMDLANYAALWLGYRRQEEDHMSSLLMQSLGTGYGQSYTEYEVTLDKMEGV